MLGKQASNRSLREVCRRAGPQKKASAATKPVFNIAARAIGRVQPSTNQKVEKPPSTTKGVHEAPPITKAAKKAVEGAGHQDEEPEA